MKSLTKKMAMRPRPLMQQRRHLLTEHRRAISLQERVVDGVAVDVSRSAVVLHPRVGTAKSELGKRKPRLRARFSFGEDKLLPAYGEVPAQIALGSFAED